METNPFAALAAFAVEVLHDETLRGSMRAGIRREDPAEFEIHFRQREEQSRQLADHCLLAGDQTGFPLDTVERRVAAVVAAIRGVMCWQLPNRPPVGVTAKMSDTLTVAVQGLQSLATRWASSQRSSAETGPPPKRGRKANTREADLQILRDWEQAREAGILFKDFCKDVGKKRAEVTRALDRARKARK